METSNPLYYQRMQTQLGVIRDLGYKLDPAARILDLGCGRGNLVREYRLNGYQAYGCDFDFPHDPLDPSLKEQGVLRKINMENGYRLSFEDNSFDCVLSDQVFEHVMDYDSTLAEVQRIAKPNGIGLHYFPSRYKIVEVHVNVPFASVIRKKDWLKFWAHMGIRNQFQKGLSATETAERNYEFLNTQTAYLKKAEIERHCRKYFAEVRFCEDIFLKYVQQGRTISGLSRLFPFIPSVYSAMHSRVLFFGNKRMVRA